MTKKSKYDEHSIERYAGLAGIQKRPTVYAGEMDSNGLWTCLREPADNAVDQALAGRNNLVHLIIDSKPNTYWVVDDGEGIPVGKKEFEDERGRKERMSTLYVVTGLVHGGGNFSGDSISRGTFGVGIKLSNALSLTFQVWTYRDNSWHSISYAKGKLVKDVHKTTCPKLPHGIKVKKGTVVSFQPDLSYFDKGSKIEHKVISEWCELTSFLVPKLTIKTTDAKGKTKQYHSKNGAADFIEKRKQELGCEVNGKIFTYNSKDLDVAVGFSNAEGSDLFYAYTNGLFNLTGGEHAKAFQDALVKSLIPYKGKYVYTPADLKEGLLGLINYKIAAPQFNTQIKEKLVDKRVYPVAHPQLLKALEDFWKKNKSLAKEVVERAAELRKRTSAFLSDKKLIQKVKQAKKALSAKLADISDQKTPISEREIFVIEGDSAGGTARVARDKRFQATYSLKGKPLNCMETPMSKIHNNAEVAGLLAGIGLDLNSKDPLSTVKFGKLIILADPDVDGKHINCLCLTVFWKFLPDLFKQGRIYIVKSPEYMTRYKGQLFFGDTKEQVYKLAGNTKVDIRHIKGWGEAEVEDLEQMAFKKGVRKLYRVLAPKNSKGALQFQALMGKKSHYRQKLLGVIK